MNDAFSRENIARWLGDQYLDALLQGDTGEAERVARDGLDAGLGAAGLYEGVVAPAMHTVGELWASGTIGVADEHLATQISHRVVALAAHLTEVADRRNRARVLAAAVEGEQHVLGLEMAAQLLEDAGYDVLFLGADVPIAELARAVIRRNPAVVALSATMPDRAGALKRTVASVQATAPATGLVLGGAAAESRFTDGSRVAVSPLADVVERVDALQQGAGLN